MDDALTQLFHQGTVVYMVCVILITFGIRRIVQTVVPSVMKRVDANEDGVTYATTFSRYWNEVILYLLPPTVGALIGVIEIPFIHGDTGPATLGGRIMSGIFVGGMSAMGYKLAKKRGVDLNQALRTTVPPEAPEESV